VSQRVPTARLEVRNTVVALVAQCQPLQVALALVGVGEMLRFPMSGPDGVIFKVGVPNLGPGRGSLLCASHVRVTEFDPARVN